MTDSLKRVSPEEAHELVQKEGYVYVDVRTEAEWDAGHPVGAINVPYALAGAAGMSPNENFVPVLLGLFEKSKSIVVGCKAGGRSLKAAQALRAAGFTNIVDQRAGFDGVRDSFGQLTEPGWAPKGLPVEKQTAGASYAESRAKAGH